MKQRDEYDRLLALLLGCPDGATEYALALQGFSKRTLDIVVGDRGSGKILTEVTTLRSGLQITRYYHEGARRYVYGKTNGK